MATALPAELHILAFDHRAAFWDALGIVDRDDKEAVTTEAKGLIWQAFEQARAVVPAVASHGAILVDDEFGGDVARAAVAADVPLGLPVEASPASGFVVAHGERFGAVLQEFPATFAKVLLRYHPTTRPMTADEQSQLWAVGEWCRENGMPWMLEVLVPRPEDAGPDFVEIDRPRLIAEAVSALLVIGFRPDIWKVEGCASVAGLTGIASAASKVQRDAKLIVLGQGADVETVGAWLRAAAVVPGFVGFAVGRTIFGPPLVDWLSGACDAATAVTRMATTYTELSAAYAGISTAVDAGS